VAQTVIDWDGESLPQGLRRLAPGRYIVSPARERGLSSEEDTAVREGLDAADAGDLVPFDEVMKEFELRSRRK
jgi:predicted transcriptional regulator